jgi:cellulose synthase/poly-beta-1,6-N-acetylglucosamine synthase-like glycosyltransferase
MTEFLHTILPRILTHWDGLILFYMLMINSVYMLLLILAIPKVYKRYKESEIENFEILMGSNSLPPITIVAPAYNEEANIALSVRSMLGLSYPNLEVIVVNDGSTDGTMEELKKEFQLRETSPAIEIKLKTKKIRAHYSSELYKNLRVIDKDNGGKADSLNVGINASESPFFMALDADTIIEHDALQRMVRPILTQENVVAAGGTIRIANGSVVNKGRVVKVRFPTQILPAIQVVEYLKSFLFGRVGWNSLGGNLVVSGAFGLFNKQVIVDVGGYLTGTVGEDIELTMRIHHELRRKKIKYNVAYIPDPVAWTEAPSTLSMLGRQRDRWHRGLADSLWRHKAMCFNPKYGWIGLVGYPFQLFGELLAPVVEMLGYLFIIVAISRDSLDTHYLLLFFGVTCFFSMILTTFSILLEEATFKKYSNSGDVLRMFFCTLVENLGYRQLCIYWRLKGLFNYLRGKDNWGKMHRKGIGDNE